MARTAPEAAAAAAQWDGIAVIKAQVLTGGRGKAGAIRPVRSPEQAEAATREILAISVKGFPVRQVLITERLDIRREFYAGITVDRQARSVVLILSSAGGMDIEEIAAREPHKIRRFIMSGGPSTELTQWLAELFRDESLWGQIASIVESMYRLFREKDCSLIEINPLAETAQGRLVAADAKMVFDDNAVMRHPDIESLRNDEEYTDEERQARQAGLSYVSLSGEIGCMVNGAGLAMATMDGIKLAGGKPANFLDVGGSSNPQKVLDAMRILLRNRQLKAILVNIFGGITRCDDIARGILAARETLDIAVPMVVRLIGTNEEEGRRVLQDAGMRVARRMTDAIEDAVACAQGGTPR